MRSISAFVLAAVFALVAPSALHAQTIGTFFFQLSPLGSVVNLTLTQKGTFYVVEGFEAQCGGNLSLPITGVGVPQANGSIFFGLTSINENGSGLHTRAYVNPANLSASTWADNTGYFNQPFTFKTSGAPVCPGGLRTSATHGFADPNAAGAPAAAAKKQ